MAREQAKVVTGMRGAEENPLMSALPKTSPVAPVYPAAPAVDGEWVFQSKVRQLQVSVKLTRGFVKGEEFVPGETITAKFKEWTYRTDDPYIAESLMFEKGPGGKFRVDPKTKERIPNKNFGVGGLYWLRHDAEAMASEAIIEQFKALARKARENPTIANRLSTDPDLKEFALPQEEDEPEPKEDRQENATE